MKTTYFLFFYCVSFALEANALTWKVKIQNFETNKIVNVTLKNPGITELKLPGLTEAKCSAKVGVPKVFEKGSDKMSNVQTTIISCDISKSYIMASVTCQIDKGHFQQYDTSFSVSEPKTTGYDLTLACYE